MFYSNNDSYMQDLYFYNQNPNSWNNFNPFMNNMNPGMQNSNMMNSNMNNMYMGQNTGYCMNQSQNLNNLYPSTYRIIFPVALRVISNCNHQYINEDVLNNMVDTVYNIVDGQIEYEEDSIAVNKQEGSLSNNNSANTNSASMSKATDTRQTTTQTVSNSRGNNRHDSLLRDIIKIIILRELLSRNQTMPNHMQQPGYYNSQMYN